MPQAARRCSSSRPAPLRRPRHRHALGGPSRCRCARRARDVVGNAYPAGVPTTTGRPLLSVGGSTADISRDELGAFVRDLADEVAATGARRVLLVPPDQTRLHSRAGEIVARLYGLLDGRGRARRRHAGARHAPAARPGRVPADVRRRDRSRSAAPPSLARRRDDDRRASRGRGRRRRRALLWASPCRSPSTGRSSTAPTTSSSSVGQVVPHEVAGFGGYTKHVSIGLGGRETIQRSHFFSAVYGIEQTLGRVDAPVRQLLDRGFDRFLEPRCRVLFVAHRRRSAPRRPVLRGVFAGEGGTRSSGRRRVPRSRRALGRGQHRDASRRRFAAASPTSIRSSTARRGSGTRRSTARGSRWRTAASSSSSRRASRASARTPSSTR